jgi:DNA-directed RNA polymerase specialized sigma24 family protein
MGFERNEREGTQVEQGWYERLTEVMTRMAGGDSAALEQFYFDFGEPIRSLIRKELRRLGVTAIDPAEADGLVLDVCIDLSRRAGSWDPSHGAAPWTWAGRRVRAIVSAHVGQFADPLPEGGLAEAEHPVVAPPAGTEGAGDDVLAAFGRLAAARREVRLLHEALDRVSRPAQQEILFEVKMQAGQGDPSPAVTVARAKALRPESVRQTCKRLLDRVSHLAATDPYFAPLADLHLLRRAS